MKKVLILALGMMLSLNVVANDCTYFLDGDTHILPNVRKTERKMENKGYQRVFSEKEATYTLSIDTDWHTGAWNGLENTSRGDVEANAKMIRNSDGAIIVHALTMTQAAGTLFGIFNNADVNNRKAARMISQILDQVPSCN